MSTACFEKDIDEYKFEIEHMAKNYDFEGYKFFNKEKIREEINSKMYLAGLLNSGSYHLNPLKLTLGLAKVAQKNNVKIFEGYFIDDIINGYGKDYINKSKKENIMVEAEIDELPRTATGKLQRFRLREY